MENFCSLFLPPVIPGEIFFGSPFRRLQHSVRYVTPHVPILFPALFHSFQSLHLKKKRKEVKEDFHVPMVNLNMRYIFFIKNCR